MQRDAEVGAIRDAIYEKHTFTLTFPDGATKHVGLGPLQRLTLV